MRSHILRGNNYHLYPRYLRLDLFTYGPDQVHAGHMSTPTITCWPYPDILIFYVDKFDVAAKSRILGLQFFYDLLDFLNIFLYILHEPPFPENRQIIVTDWSFFGHA